MSTLSALHSHWVAEEKTSQRFGHRRSLGHTFTATVGDKAATTGGRFIHSASTAKK